MHDTVNWHDKQVDVADDTEYPLHHGRQRNAISTAVGFDHPACEVVRLIWPWNVRNTDEDQIR